MKYLAYIALAGVPCERHESVNNPWVIKARWDVPLALPASITACLRKAETNFYREGERLRDHIRKIDSPSSQQCNPLKCITVSTESSLCRCDVGSPFKGILRSSLLLICSTWSVTMVLFPACTKEKTFDSKLTDNRSQMAIL